MAAATPVAIAAEDATLTLTSPIAPAVFTGTLNAEGTEISGTLAEGATQRAVVFTRVASRERLGKWPATTLLYGAVAGLLLHEHPYVAAAVMTLVWFAAVSRLRES